MQLWEGALATTAVWLSTLLGPSAELYPGGTFNVNSFSLCHQFACVPTHLPTVRQLDITVVGSAR